MRKIMVIAVLIMFSGTFIVPQSLLAESKGKKELKKTQINLTQRKKSLQKPLLSGRKTKGKLIYIVVATAAAGGVIAYYLLKPKTGELIVEVIWPN